MTQRTLSPTDLQDMTTEAIRILTEVRGGTDPDVQDVSTLAHYVDALAAEVDRLHWRATVATMALDGRVHPDEVQLGPP